MGIFDWLFNKNKKLNESDNEEKSDLNRRKFATGLATIGATAAIGIPNEAEAAKRKNKTKTNVLQNKILGSTATIYYETNSWTLKRNDLLALNKFLKSFKKSNFIIEGYCDPRGTEEFNLELGEKRVLGVEDYILGFNSSAFTIPISYGESRLSSSNLAENRKVILIADTNIFERALSLIPADIYLVDTTYSMKNNIAILRNHQYKNNAAIYTFNSIDGLQRNYDPKTITVSGETPLWDSLYKLIEESPSNKSIVVLTDGNDNQSRQHNYQHIIDLAKTKGIIINTIGITVNSKTKRELITISRLTGGSFYIQNK